MHGEAIDRVRVKICGITRPRDGLEAARRGADAIGLVFYPNSPRAVDCATAAEVVVALPPFVSVVGLFVNAEPQTVHDVLARVPLDLLQFHGDESAEYCGQFDRPYLKALRMHADIDLVQEAARYAGARGLLLDAYRPGVPGGTGECFDWERVPGQLAKPVVLAGGLTPENVVAAIAAVRPYGVDLSSGVELAKGIKDPARIKALMDAIRAFPGT